MQETDFDFLKDDQDDLQGDALARLNALVDQQQSIENEIAVQEEKLSALKKQLMVVSSEEIPMLLGAKGLSEIRLNNGKKIIIKEDISVSIKDKAKFFNFLTDRNEADIIKTTFVFDRMPTSLKKKLFDYIITHAQSVFKDTVDVVHPQTLKKYVSTLLGIDKSIDKETYQQGLKDGTFMRLSELPECINVFHIKKTKIK